MKRGHHIMPCSPKMKKVLFIPSLVLVVVWLGFEFGMLLWESGSTYLMGGWHAYLLHFCLYSIIALVLQFGLSWIARVVHRREKSSGAIILVYLTAWILGVIVFCDHYGDLLGSLPWLVAFLLMGYLTAFLLRRVEDEDAT